MTPFEIATIALAIVSGIFGVIGWLLIRLIDNQKQFHKDREVHRVELAAEKDKTVETKFDQLIQRMDDLVKQISHLFRDQEVLTKGIDNLNGRVGIVEKRVSEGFAHCEDRNSLIKDLKVRQDAGLRDLNKLRGATASGGHRISDKPSDRSDREN